MASQTKQIYIRRFCGSIGRCIPKPPRSYTTATCSSFITHAFANITIKTFFTKIATATPLISLIGLRDMEGSRHAPRPFDEDYHIVGIPRHRLRYVRNLEIFTRFDGYPGIGYHLYHAASNREVIIDVLRSLISAPPEHEGEGPSSNGKRTLKFTYTPSDWCSERSMKSSERRLLRAHIKKRDQLLHALSYFRTVSLCTNYEDFFANYPMKERTFENLTGSTRENFMTPSKLVWMQAEQRRNAWKSVGRLLELEE